MNLPKLLRTLSQYKAESLLLIASEHPRIWLKNQWREIAEHPICETEEIENESQKLLDKSVFLEEESDRFKISLLTSRQGPVLKVDRMNELKRLEDFSDHQEKIQSWLDHGGLILTDSELHYDSLLKIWSQNKKGLALSLETEAHAPQMTFLGNVIQQEVDKDILNLEAALAQIDLEKVDLLALSGWAAEENIAPTLETFADGKRVLIQVHPFHSVWAFRKPVLLRV